VRAFFGLTAALVGRLPVLFQAFIYDRKDMPVAFSCEASTFAIFRPLWVIVLAEPTPNLDRLGAFAFVPLTAATPAGIATEATVAPVAIRLRPLRMFAALAERIASAFDARFALDLRVVAALDLPRTPLTRLSVGFAFALADWIGFLLPAAPEILFSAAFTRAAAPLPTLFAFVPALFAFVLAATACCTAFFPYFFAAWVTPSRPIAAAIATKGSAMSCTFFYK
jgi:hypothetical protein